MSSIRRMLLEKDSPALSVRAVSCKLLLLVVFFLLTVARAGAQDLSEEQERTWTDAKGKKIQAKLIRYTPRQVTLQADGGRTINITVEKLSATDKRYLRSRFTITAGNEEETADADLLASVKATPLTPGTRAIRGQFTAVRGICYSEEGRLRLTWRHNNDATLQEIDTGLIVSLFTGCPSSAETVAFTSDGGRYVTPTGASDISLRRTLDDVEIGRFQGHQQNISTLTFSRNDSQFASGSDDKTVNIWKLDAEDSKPHLTLEGHTGRIIALAYHPTDERLITGSQDGTAILWDMRSGRPLRSLPDQGGGPVSLVAFDRTGAVGVVASVGTVVLWDTYIPPASSVRSYGRSRSEQKNPLLQDDPLLVMLTPKMPEMESEGVFHGVAFSNDGKRILVTSKIGNTIYADIPERKILRKIDKLESGINRVAFNGDDRELLTGSFDESSLRWFSEIIDDTPKRFPGHNYGVAPIRFFAGGKLTVTSGGAVNGTLAIYETATGKLLRRLESHPGAVEWIDMTNNGARLVSVSRNEIDTTSLKSGTKITPTYTVVLWDTATSQALLTVDRVRTWAMSNDGRHLITTRSESQHRENEVTFWNMQTGKETIKGKWEGAGSEFLILQESNAVLASRGRSETFTIDEETGVPSIIVESGSFFQRSLRSGKEGRQFKNMKYDPFCVALGDSGRLLISPSRFQWNHAVIWKLQNEQKPQAILEHPSRVMAVALSRDGTLALTGSLDNSAVLWNATDGTPLQKFSGLSAPVIGVGFDDEANLLLYGTEDGAVTVAAIDPAHKEAALAAKEAANQKPAKENDDEEE